MPFTRSVLTTMLVSLTLVLGLTWGPSQAATKTAAPTVVGGADASISDFPWQVLFIVDGDNVCSGSLVSSTQILSAAHCFAGHSAAQIQGWAGITRMQDRSSQNQLAIASVLAHPKFDPATFANDLAIVTLKNPVSGTLGTATIGLPSTQDAAAWPAAGTAAMVSGWGETDPAKPVASDRLQAANVQVLTSPGTSVCGSYGNAYQAGSQLCAGVETGGIDACQGDSGGPLTITVAGRPILAGISSTGFECAATGYPGLYVRTTAFLPWLAANGVNVSAAGGTAIADLPGSNRDGIPSNFRIGQTYPASTFAKAAQLSTTKARITVTGGAACTQVRQTVRFDKAGKCRITVSQGSKRVPLVVTLYSA